MALEANAVIEAVIAYDSKFLGLFALTFNLLTLAILPLPFNTFCPFS